MSLFNFDHRDGSLYMKHYSVQTITIILDGHDVFLTKNPFFPLGQQVDQTTVF